MLKTKKSPNIFQIFATETNKDASIKTSLFPSYTICLDIGVIYAIYFIILNWNKIILKFIIIIIIFATNSSFHVLFISSFVLYKSALCILFEIKNLI